MEKFGLLKKRTTAVYPENLKLDSLKRTHGTSGSWVTTSNSPTTQLIQPSHCSDIEEQNTDEESSEDAMINNDSIRPDTGRSQDRRQSTRDLYNCVQNNNIIPSSENNLFINGRLRHLVHRFTERAHRMRQRLEIPPTPSTLSSSESESPSRRSRIIHAVNQPQSSPITQNGCDVFCNSIKPRSVIDPQGYFYISWLFVVTLCYTYNIWVIPLRSSFPFQTPENTHIWFGFDYFADVMYLIDVVAVRPRVMYLLEGFWVRDLALTRKNYMRKFQFKLDVLSLLPLDFLYFYFGTGFVILRFPRMLKLQTFWEFYKLLDRVLASPHFIRVLRTLTYMLYMIHLNACAYYAYSAWEGLGTNRWVFSGKGHPYVRCFAFATKTATSIGKNPKPESEGEYLFMTAAWLMGVFVFALLIGQIRDIIATATRNQSEFRKLVDETMEYMRRLNLPIELQRRVNMWFKYTWEQQHTLDEGPILDTLPPNLKTDVAINVHIQTLGKVKLFADCDEALLRELVLKLRSVIFLPGDNVCRKGEVGREMYIVKTGQVQVLGSNDEVLATLSEGSVFGEISLLAINNAEGGNRRTADVRSHGFSNLFVLDKNDLNEALEHYPDAQEILRKKAKALMRANAARERQDLEKCRQKFPEPEVVIHNPSKPEVEPKLLTAVIQALPEHSAASQLLRLGSKRVPKPKMFKNQIGVLEPIHSSDNNIFMNNTGSSTISEPVRISISEPFLSGEVPEENKRLHRSEVECNVTVHREM